MQVGSKLNRWEVMMAKKEREKKPRGTGYLYKRGGYYWLEYRANGQRVREPLHDEAGKGITTKEAALLAQNRIVHPLLAKDRVQAAKDMVVRLQDAETVATTVDEQSAPKLLLGGVWDAYRNAPNRPDSSEATLNQYSFQWGRLLTWLTDNKPDRKELRDVTEEDAEEYVADLAKAIGPSTYNRHITFLKCLFRVLSKQAKITGNPWDAISRKRSVGQSRRELTVEELKNVCSTATGELRTLLLIGIYTGLRLGDCATLSWGETDLIRGIITRIPHKTGRKNPKPVIVPIHAALSGVLSETPKHARTGYVLSKHAEEYLRNRTVVTRRVQGLFEVCKIQTHMAGTGEETGRRAVVEVGFHSLRHSFVSLCRQANAPLSVVESIVGHSSPAMTRHYTHTGEDSARLAVNALPSVVKSPKGKKGDAHEPRTALPDWALKLVRGMNEENWANVKASLLSRGKTDKVPAAKPAQTKTGGDKVVEIQPETIQPAQLSVGAEPAP